MKLGENIKAHRDRLGMTQEELGSKIGVTKMTVSQWERGMMSPKVEKIRRLADIFMVSPADLMADDINVTNNKVITRLASQMTNDEQAKVIDYMNFILSQRKR